MITELDYSVLKRHTNIEDLGDEVKALDDNSLIGQSTGEEALKFGLNVKSKGYNIYVAGANGSGKTSFAEKFAREMAAKEKTPDDMCYVYNFDNPIVPKALFLPAGKGKELKADMAELINRLTYEITKSYNSLEYQEEKDRIMKSYQKKKDEVINGLSDKAKEYGFGVKQNPTGGIYFLPLVDGKMINEDDFEDLDDETREKISSGSEEVQELAASTMRSLKTFDSDAKNEVENADYNIALMVVGRFMNKLQSKYVNCENVMKYLASVKEDILENIDEFNNSEDTESDDPITNMVPWLSKKAINDDFLGKYDINVVVDNSNLHGAPVITNFNPSYVNLVGEIEYENENGNLITDFMKIKSGLMHKANGGYIIFHASDMVGNAFAWDTLRKILKTGTVTIEPLKEYQLGGITVSAIRPETTEVNVKVILVGSLYYYEMLKEYDDDFSKLFKMCVLFDYEMDYNEKNIDSVVSFVNNFVSKENLKPIDKNAIRQLVEYSTRVAERQDKMTTRFGTLGDVLIEANTWANMDGLDTINEKCVLKAINKRIERVNIYAEKYIDMIKENEILIDTTGEKVGQINGLCVMEMDDYTFGMPTRITASTYTGKAGIVNIEKEAEMSGSIHDKGVQVCIGYLGGKYAQKFPLTLSCRVCFEQSYNGVDGDSATSTETYCILSSLSGLPIRQDLAVTGSMNQRGEIQPIGGVTYKIEGFYNICKNKGLTGTQGVIIPRSNIKDMVLSDEVVESVKNKQFHIYAIDNVDDGIELLMGQKAGKALASGGFSKDSVHSKVYNKLKNYYKISVQE